MGVLGRIGRATRGTLTDIKNRTFGRANKPLSELSDGELEEELLRRRRERASKRAGEKAGSTPGAVSPREKQLSQYYANLELAPGATLEEVKAAYRDLMRKYHPDKHLGDPDRHRASTELAQSLTQAYQALLAHLTRT